MDYLISALPKPLILYQNVIKSLNDGHFHPPFEKFIRFSLLNILLVLSSHDYLEKTSSKSLKIIKISTSASQVELFGIIVKRGSDDTEVLEEKKIWKRRVEG